jgi:hypothetical protein
MTTAPLLPERIEQLSDVAVRDQRLYERDTWGDAYQLSYAGTALANYRRLAAENSGVPVPPPRKVVRFDREGWALLLAVAEPEARAYFIQCAAAKSIKVG